MADGADVSAYIVEAYRSTYVVEVNYIAATALFCFDYFLTFGQEVQLVWKRGLSTSTVLFYAVRYPAFFSTLFVILDIIPFKGMSVSRALYSCGVLIHVDMALNVILLTAAAVFSSLRVYALWDRNRWVLAAVLLLGMANPAISIYTFSLMEPVLFTVPANSCGFFPTSPNAVYENWMVGARMSSVLADVLVLVATWSRTWPMRAEAARINFTSTFATILMRDGTMYFIVLLAANVIGLGFSRHFELVEPISTWIAIVTAILTSRFILDLHHAADTLGGAGDGTHISELGTLVFRGSESATASHTRAARTSRSVYGMVFTRMTGASDSEGGGEWDAVVTPESASPAIPEKDRDVGVAV